MRPRKPRKITLNRMTATSVIVAGERLLLEVRPRDGREVEADERHDRSGDDRRHEPVDPADARELHDEADGGEQDADRHDAGERRAHAGGRGRRRDRSDERERRAEVAGQLVARDQQEQERPDAREEAASSRPGSPVSTGTRNVAPNIATTCWTPMATSRASSGARPASRPRRVRRCGRCRAESRRACGAPSTLREMVLPSRYLGVGWGDDGERIRARPLGAQAVSRSSSSR